MDDNSFQTFVETSTMRSLREAVEAGQSPIVLSGNPGAGKTAMLYALEREWSRSGRPVAYVGLAHRQAPEHIVDEIVQKMGLRSLETKRRVIVSSSSASSEQDWIGELSGLKNANFSLAQSRSSPRRRSQTHRDVQSTSLSFCARLRMRLRPRAVE